MISIPSATMAHITRLLTTAMADAEQRLSKTQDPLRDIATFRERLHYVNQIMQEALENAKLNPRHSPNAYQTIEFLHDMQQKLTQAEEIKREFTLLVEIQAVKTISFQPNALTT
ncbi:hypothetical protein THRCLA_22295 [Thraustotheca clavata]|uniref:Uncharacterized protein n=1 Tax=Thraustotheca clavata TaxID=74557 RepID=A0A1V9Z6K1_9STRA|nr:hypothetical protein THRCLA_22295 [Thraustotheca clavata]